MIYTAKKLLEIAAAEIGYKEKETNSQLDNKTANAGDDNYTKYARDLHAAGYYQASKQGYAWCDMFVDWCFLQLCGGDADKAQKIICQSGPYGAGCKFSAQYYQNAGRYYEDDPQPGDQIFFNDFAHTGIVEKVVGNVVHTIEGNTSNQVARRTYTLGSKTIDGYGRPRFDAEEAAAPVVVTGHISTGTDEDNMEIFDALVAGGLTPAGAAGLMGNFMAESAMKSENLQNTGNKKLDMTDAEYTSYVDNGTYTNFAKDGHGYGLAQWTYWTRKRDLLAFAKKMGKSIGDSMMQVAFTLLELKSYASVLKVLQTTTSVKEASDIVLTKFERPADMSDAVKTKRAAYGQTFYNKFYISRANKTVEEIAKEVLAGKWGNGAERKQRLTDAGYNYDTIQARVNELVAQKNRKSVDELAREVIAGKWGNGQERKDKLTAEGYDYAAVQKRVNELLA